ncbi:YcgN family cysteine cluster protein [Sphingomicrobium astaxanthinifaciens]|uniref:YcgN family cysteine cluster protein n=1 Tax=Sphingomicrobium astaxanthinifaciens TaxID=1227949 RepID=UPI001FCB7CFC|nr:YcgN family cysteine cluster protein [Sphingomicrobium astaxanthinifaciens]MCJ7421161.1 YcgN family cysteine cluster protein [Sphingomicrobium astaxanthinifaciens]
MNSKKPFWEKPLAELDAGQWEALCDGCGRCCLHKAEDADTGAHYPTNVACRLLDRQSGRCTNYGERKTHVPDCLQLTADKVAATRWLPSTCAYRLRAEDKPLPVWHHLLCGDPEAVHREGQSVRGWTVSEDEAGDIEHHLVDRAL